VGIIAESVVQAAVAAGRKLSLDDLPSEDDLAALSAVERKQLSRRLGPSVVRARNGEYSSGACRSAAALIIRGRIGGELCRHSATGATCENPACPFVHRALRAQIKCAAEISTSDVASCSVRLHFSASSQRHHHRVSSAAAAKQARAAAAAVPPPARQRDMTFGQISQYKKDTERPRAGIILVPIESAAAASVSFGPKRQGGARATGAAVRRGTAAATVGTTTLRQRPGFESSKALALHYETVDCLTSALATCPDALHEWVAAESEHASQLPEVFREVWQQYEKRDRERSAAGTGKDPVASAAEDESVLDVETLHARLRRRMRHSMHVMMQEHNPDSYYRDVVHPERVD
jgi:hypothetical protein